MSKLKIYTDGSHLKHTTGRLGVGGIIVKDDKIIDEFSKEVSTDYLKLSYGTSDVSNPTCEMLAALHALYYFKNDINAHDTIELYADYQGVSSWLNGTWKINKPYIQKIKDDINEEINRQHLKGRITFHWVKGHQKGDNQDAIYNNIVDKLSKGEDYGK